jgi:hypothetical protein
MRSIEKRCLPAGLHRFFVIFYDSLILCGLFPVTRSRPISRATASKPPHLQPSLRPPDETFAHHLVCGCCCRSGFLRRPSGRRTAEENSNKPTVAISSNGGKQSTLGCTGHQIAPAKGSSPVRFTTGRTGCRPRPGRTHFRSF